MYNVNFNAAYFANNSSINANVVNYTHDEVCAELMALFVACNAGEQGYYNTDALLDALSEAYEEDCAVVQYEQDISVVLGRANAVNAINAYEDCCYGDAQHYALLALLVRNKYLQLAIG